MTFGQSTVPLEPMETINHHDASFPDYRDLTAEEQAELRASDRDVFSGDYEAPPPPPTYADSTGNGPSIAAPIDIKERDPWLVPPLSDSVDGNHVIGLSTTARPSSPVPSMRLVTAEAGAFVPGKVLKIAARGVGLIRLPIRNSELEIPIQRQDGSTAYLSLRETKSSGNSVLLRGTGLSGDGQVATEVVATTEYTFGPSKEPVVRCMPMGSSGFPPMATQTSPGLALSGWQQAWKQGEQGAEVRITGKWTRKTCGFSSPEGAVFEWRYIREKDSAGKKRLNLALFMLPNQTQYEAKAEKKDKAVEGMRVAQLVRTEDTRPAGTSKCSAGNGGELVFHSEASKYISEELVVATCLVMLKKEVDRRRMVQAIMFGAATGAIIV